MVNIDATADIVRTVMGQGGKTGRFQAKDKVKLLREGAKDTDNLTFQILEDLNEKGVKGKIGGSPFLLNGFLSWMEDSGKRLKLGDGWIIQTGGGGSTSHEKLKPCMTELNECWESPVRIAETSTVLTESTIPFPACEGHYYHIAHTLLHPFVLNDELEPMGYGEFGRFAFIDPVSHAYPGCIITGDRIKLLESCPSCDKPGPVISPPSAGRQGQKTGDALPW